MARLVVYALLATLSPIVTGANAEDYQNAIDTLTYGQPPDIAAFAARRVECNHWSGEEPYDKQHAAEIADAVQRLRCEDLDGEERTLRRRYAKRPAVLRVLNTAAGLF
jgi:hypothetical protein